MEGRVADDRERWVLILGASSGFGEATARELAGSEEIVARIAQLGYLPIGGGPTDYAANLRSEIKKWGDVVARANVRID